MCHAATHAMAQGHYCSSQGPSVCRESMICWYSLQVPHSFLWHRKSNLKGFKKQEDTRVQLYIGCKRVRHHTLGITPETQILRLKHARLLSNATHREHREPQRHTFNITSSPPSPVLHVMASLIMVCRRVLTPTALTPPPMRWSHSPRAFTAAPWEPSP
jgi:hypothetical protein